MPYRHAAVAWLTRRLREPIVAAAEQAASAALDPDDERPPWWRSLRESLGDLQRLTVKASRQGSPVAAAAGSYEPEVYGYGPVRMVLTLEAIGSVGAAEFVVEVLFPDGLSKRPNVSLEETRLRARTPPPSRQTAEEIEIERLSEAICAAPDDDEPRAQLAALWTARGEPRGEFVRAQLSGDEAGAQALLARYGEHWTDGLPVDRDGRVYHRGFLSEARVTCAPIHVSEAMESPAWNLLTALHLSTTGTVEESFLKHARLGSLRRLSGISAETLESTRLPPRVTHLQTRGRVYECPERLKALEIETYSFEGLWVFARQQKHPHLSLLSVSVHRAPVGADRLVIRGLLEEPRPARLVLTCLRREPGDEVVEVWRLEVTAETWDFRGDEQVSQQLREMARKPEPHEMDEL